MNSINIKNLSFPHYFYSWNILEYASDLDEKFLERSAFVPCGIPEAVGHWIIGRGLQLGQDSVHLLDLQVVVPERTPLAMAQLLRDFLA